MMMPLQTDDSNGARAGALAKQQCAQQYAKDRVHKSKDRDAADGVDGKQARPQRVGDRGDKRHVDDEHDGGDNRCGGERATHQKADGGEDQAADQELPPGKHIFLTLAGTVPPHFSCSAL